MALVARLNLNSSKEQSDDLKPAALSTDQENGCEENPYRRPIHGPRRHGEMVVKTVERLNEEAVEEFVSSFHEEIVLSPEPLPIEEAIEDIIPEQYRLIPHTSYTVLKKVIDTFMASKRRTRDVENIDTFIRGGPKSDCARIDAQYRIGAGRKSHIAVQENEQYWAEQEKLFPHLKQMHEEEVASLEKTSEEDKYTDDDNFPS